MEEKIHSKPCKSLCESAQQPFFLCFVLVKGDAGIAVLKINDTAAGKAVLLQRILHRYIVPVRVDTQIKALGKGKIIAKRCHAPPMLCNRDPVDHPVGFVVEPASLVNGMIGWVIMNEKAENAQYFPFLQA